MKQGILLIIGMLMLAACGGAAAPENTVVPTADTQNTAVDSAPATQGVVETPAAETVAQANSGGSSDAVAIVNGQPIPRADFDREMARRLQVMGSADTNVLSEIVLQTMIEQKIIVQAAENLGISVSDAEIDAEVERLYQEVNSQQAWNDWLAANMYTEAEFREAQRELLISNRVRDAVVSVEGDAVPQVRARHILVATEAEAQDVLRRLESGEDFGAVAADVSRDVTSRDRGGDLGFFVRENLTTPELADVAFSLQPGELAGPVSTALGYHVIETLEFDQRAASPEEQQEQVQMQFNAWMVEQLSSASIERILE